MNKSEWIRVTKDEPCKICDHGDWCCVTSDGRLANCMRIESDKPCKNGGWLYKLDGDTKPKYYLPKAKAKVADVNFYKLAKDYFCGCLSTANPLAERLGVSEDSLQRLGTGYDGKNYVFPMWDGTRKMIGMRLRTPDGKKFSVTGSKNGLFWPQLVKSDSKNLLFICEGPTDCAALLDLGFDAIGRPSCSGGTEHIKTMLTGHDKQVVIFSDKDEAKTRPDGKTFRPGQEGAARLAKEILPLCRWVKIIKPCKGKDVRQWYQAGATAAAVMAVVKNTRFI